MSDLVARLREKADIVISADNSALFSEAATLIESQAAKIAELEARLAKVNRIATDRQYMMHAYKIMLGPIATELVKKWEDRGVLRQHTSWGPKADKLTGEERAQVLLDAFVDPRAARSLKEGEQG
jgi:hypothetical protein